MKGNIYKENGIQIIPKGDLTVYLHSLFLKANFFSFLTANRHGNEQCQKSGILPLKEAKQNIGKATDKAPSLQKKNSETAFICLASL